MTPNRRRVIWSEGMALDPQHLQQWDRHVGGLVSARARSLTRYDWGLTRLELDRDRLSNGELAVVAVAGILPDGLVFDVPEQDAAPAARAIADAFDAGADRMAVYLAVPAERAGEPVVLREGGSNGATRRREARYVSGVVAAPDDNTGADAREIEVAAPNLQLRLGSEALDGFTAIRIAEVVRTPAGAFAFDDRFVPTSLRLAAAPPLQQAGRRLIELLVAQRAVLAERRQAILRKPAITPADVVALHLYEVVCGAIPRVAHHADGDGAAPEALFLTMAELAARLASWVPAARVPDLPLYEHADLTGCFGKLTTILWALLGEAAPEADYIEIPLHALRPNVFAGQADADLLNRAALFLLAGAPETADEGALVDLPTKLRVASPQTIESVLRSATRALPLEVVDTPPPGVPVRPGARVLALQKRGPFWEAIIQGAGVAVYVPAEVGRLDLKLIAVLKL